METIADGEDFTLQWIDNGWKIEINANKREGSSSQWDNARWQQTYRVVLGKMRMLRTRSWTLAWLDCSYPPPQPVGWFQIVDYAYLVQAVQSSG